MGEVCSAFLVVEWMAVDSIFSALHLYLFWGEHGKIMTLGWASPSIVLLRSGRDEVQCPCTGAFEKLSNKTPSGNMQVVLEDPVSFLKGRWGCNFFCCHSQKKVLSEHYLQLLGSVYHAASLAVLCLG